MVTFGNQVVLVEGARRGALVDLHAARLQRVPADFGCNFRHGVLLPNHGITAEWMASLLASGFLIENEAIPYWQMFGFEWKHPPYPRLHTIAVDQSADLDQVSEWLIKSRIRPRHIIFAGHDGCRQFDELVSLASLSECRSFEVTDGELNEAHESTVYSSTGRSLFRTVSKPPERNSITFKLKIDAEFYLLSMMYGETFGYLYLKDDAILPHHNERFVSFGSMNDTSLDEVLEGGMYQKIAYTNKDKRDQCRHCELRYVCNDSISNRRRAALTSGPENCIYDPTSDDDQNHLFTAV